MRQYFKKESSLLKWVLAVVLGIPLLFGVTMMSASEFGGEVVKLHTLDEKGESHVTSLWVVEEGEDLWLRSGVPTSSWLVRIRANSEVELERAGVRAKYLAVPEPDKAAWLHERMRENYGFADQVISAMRPGGDSVAVRLNRLSP